MQGRVVASRSADGACAAQGDSGPVQGVFRALLCGAALAAQHGCGALQGRRTGFGSRVGCRRGRACLPGKLMRTACAGRRGSGRTGGRRAAGAASSCQQGGWSVQGLCGAACLADNRSSFVTRHPCQGRLATNWYTFAREIDVCMAIACRGVGCVLEMRSCQGI